jgi:hypothetical protein
MNIAVTQMTLFAPDERRRARAKIAVAAVGGAASQALFWRTGLGLNFFVWDLAAIGSAFILLRRGKVRPTAAGAMVAAALLGFAVVRYASDWTMAIAAPTTLALLAALPYLLRDGYTLDDLGLLPGRLLGSYFHFPRAFAESAKIASTAAGAEGKGTLGKVVRGMLLGVPLAGLFALLFASDSDFVSALGRLRDRVGDATLFTLWSVATGAGYLVTYAFHTRPETDGARPGRVEDAYRTVDIPRPAPASRVSVLAWSIVLTQVTLVFALFVAANLRHLFGGAALVRAPGELTYATYLHSGFGELLFATLLSVCLVLAGHGLLRPRGEAGRLAPVPGGRVLAALEGALLLFSAVTVASCWQRLSIYVDAYGASLLRLGVAFIEVGILGVLALTFGKAVFRGWRGHAGALLAFLALLAVVASGFNADAYVVKTNLDRAAHGHDLDTEYVTSLSRDAAAVLDHPYVRADHDLQKLLVASYCAPPSGGVRAFRGLTRCSPEAGK